MISLPSVTDAKRFIYETLEIAVIPVARISVMLSGMEQWNVFENCRVKPLCRCFIYLKQDLIHCFIFLSGCGASRGEIFRIESAVCSTAHLHSYV
jgi:hypothetical protein